MHPRCESRTPGWQPKETASQLRKQGRLLNQRHSFVTPRSRGVGTPCVAGPLTTSLRGLWVSGLLPRCNGGTRKGGDPKTDQRRRGLTQNSRTGNPKRVRPNCHSKEVKSNQRGCHHCTNWPKGQEPWRRGATGFCKLSWQLLVPIPQRPQQELEVLRLDEDEPPREAAVVPEQS